MIIQATISSWSSTSTTPHHRTNTIIAQAASSAAERSRPDSPQRRRDYEKGALHSLGIRDPTAPQGRSLSQRELAELVGTTQSAIARLEGGNISPSLPTLDRIAHALGAELYVTFTDLEHLTSTG